MAWQNSRTAVDPGGTRDWSSASPGSGTTSVNARRKAGSQVCRAGWSTPLFQQRQCSDPMVNPAPGRGQVAWGCKELVGDAGDGLADGVGGEGGGGRVVRRGVRVEDDRAGAGLGGDGAQRGGGLDGERAANGQEEVAVGGRGGGAVEHARVQRLAEHHGGRLEDPAAPRA